MPEVELEFEVAEQGELTVVTLVGELDLVTAPVLRARLEDLIAAAPAIQLVVDLEGVDFLDSAGLGVLMSTLNSVREAGGAFRLVCTRPRLLKVFEITALTEVLDIRSTVEG